MSHTCCDLGIDLYPRVFGNQIFRKLYTLMDRDPVALKSACYIQPMALNASYAPLPDDGIVFHAV